MACSEEGRALRGLAAVLALWGSMVGCGADPSADGDAAARPGDEVPRIEAVFSHDDGRTFRFSQPATAGEELLEVVPGKKVRLWTVAARDPTTRYSIQIMWMSSAVPQPATFQLAEHSLQAESGALGVLVFWPADDKPGSSYGVASHGGTLTFERLGYQDHDVVSGRFDGLRVDVNNAAYEVHLSVTQGTFLGVVR